jgi:colanic acid/amylovoran biosynthesis glycosyltransferase
VSRALSSGLFSNPQHFLNPMSLAYLVNQHPKCSQSFIRRELLALESLGFSIQRFSIRSGADLIVDPADRQELAKTRVLLDVGPLGLLGGLVRSVRHPILFLRALALAVRLGRRSDRGLIIHLIYLAEASVLRGWLKRDRIEHLHVHFGTNSTMVALLCRAMGGPTYSFTVHGPEEFDRVSGIALAEKIKHAAFVVGISSFGCGQLYRWCDHRDWNKIREVHCGVDRQYLQRPIEPIADVPHLVCVARLCEQKGQLLLIEAIHQLKLEGILCRLTLVGDGPLRSVIDDRIRDYRLDDHVQITGYVTGDRVQSYILNARAFVLPSFGEGLPVAIMEAFALGRPVISTYVAGIPELVKPGENGWLVPVGDLPQLIQAIKDMLATPIEQLERMGQNGASRVAERHDVTVEGQKIADYFSELLSNVPQACRRADRLTSLKTSPIDAQSMTYGADSPVRDPQRRTLSPIMPK